MWAAFGRKLVLECVNVSSFLCKTWRACIMSSELFTSYFQRTAFWICLPPSHGWGNALLKVRQCFKCCSVPGCSSCQVHIFKPEFKMTFCPAVTHHGLLEKYSRFIRESLCCLNWKMTFERFGWISELNFLDYPLTQTEYGTGCSIMACATAEFSVNVCILEENPVKHPDCWIRCLSLKLFLSIQHVDFCRFWLYLCLNQES